MHHWHKGLICRRSHLVPILRMVGVAAVVSLGVLAAYYQLSPFRWPDVLLYESKFPTHDKIFNNIFLVQIDDDSLERVGAWPWNRGIVANLIQRVLAADPAVVAVDVAFEDAKEKTGDEALANLVGQNRKVLVLATIYRSNGTINLYPALAKQHPQTGYVNLMRPEGFENSVAISCPPVKVGPSFPETIASTYRANLTSLSEAQIITAPRSSHPNYRHFGDCAWAMNFAGDLRAFKSISAVDLLNNASLAASIPKGSVVIIGPFGQSMGDYHYSPLSRGKHTPGPVIVAYAVNTILTENYIITMGHQLLALLVFVVALLSLIGAFTIRRNLVFLVFAIGSIALTYLTQSVLFDVCRYYFPVGPMGITVLVVTFPRMLLWLVSRPTEQRPPA